MLRPWKRSAASAAPCSLSARILVACPRKDPRSRGGAPSARREPVDIQRRPSVYVVPRLQPLVFRPTLGLRAPAVATSRRLPPAAAPAAHAANLSSRGEIPALQRAVMITANPGRIGRPPSLELPLLKNSTRRVVNLAPRFATPPPLLISKRGSLDGITSSSASRA
jgi:hypothetical protein